ncbi:hypothetical protein ColTof4_06311 [Colletotrichum tofieldiae]|nr:hypothetical protein ColTof4_06311 [Colletotrichum tofieldiae]
MAEGTLARIQGCGPSVLAKEAGDLVSNTLGADEDENLVLLVVHHLLEVLDHAIALLALVDNLDDLGNAVVGSQLHGADVDLNEVGKEVRRKGADLLGPSSGPHECLTVRANLANDLANLRLETHVQHAISLVENQVGLASLQHVDETSGGCDADLDTAGEVADLRTLGNTTVDAGVANAGRLAELGNLLLNLDRELTGGSEDQDNRAVAGGQQRLGVDVNNGGQAVGEGLSGTRLGNTDNVATGKSHGPALGLNGSRSGEALGLDLVHDISGESSLVEGLDGLGDIVASNGDLVLATEGLDLSRAAVGDLLVLLVERLFEFGHRVEVCLMVRYRHWHHTVGARCQGSSSLTNPTDEFGEWNQ